MNTDTFEDSTVFEEFLAGYDLGYSDARQGRVRPRTRSEIARQRLVDYLSAPEIRALVADFASQYRIVR